MPVACLKRLFLLAFCVPWVVAEADAPTISWDGAPPAWANDSVPQDHPYGGAADPGVGASGVRRIDLQRRQGAGAWNTAASSAEPPAALPTGSLAYAFAGADSDGVYEFRWRVVDNDGNEAFSVATRTVTLDTVAPAIAWNGAPASPTSNTSPTSFAYDGASDADSGVALIELLRRPGTSGAFSVVASDTSPASPDGSIAYSFAGGDADGSYQFRWRITDAAGNATTPTTTQTVILDSSGPTIDWGTAPVDGSHSNGSIDLAYTNAADGGGVDRIEIWRRSLPFGSFALVGTDAAPDLPSGSIAYGFASGDADGAWAFELRIVDDASNTTATSTTRNVTLDREDPGIIWTDAGALPGHAKVGDTVTITYGSAVDDQSVDRIELRVDGAVAGTSTVTPAGAIPYTFTSTLGNGSYAFSLHILDRAGNSTGASANDRAIVFNKTAPTIAWDGSSPDRAIEAQATQWLVKYKNARSDGSSSDPITDLKAIRLHYQVENPPGTVINSGTLTKLQADGDIISEGGSFSFTDFSSLGTFSFQLEVEDLSGNTFTHPSSATRTPSQFITAFFNATGSRYSNGGSVGWTLHFDDVGTSNLDPTTATTEIESVVNLALADMLTIDSLGTPYATVAALNRIPRTNGDYWTVDATLPASAGNTRIILRLQDAAPTILSQNTPNRPLAAGTFDSPAIIVDTRGPVTATVAPVPAAVNDEHITVSHSAWDPGSGGGAPPATPSASTDAIAGLRDAVRFGDSNRAGIQFHATWSGEVDGAPVSGSGTIPVAGGGPISSISTAFPAGDDYRIGPSSFAVDLDDLIGLAGTESVELDLRYGTIVTDLAGNSSAMPPATLVDLRYDTRRPVVDRSPSTVHLSTTVDPAITILALPFSEPVTANFAVNTEPCWEITDGEGMTKIWTWAELGLANGSQFSQLVLPMGAVSLVPGRTYILQPAGGAAATMHRDLASNALDLSAGSNRLVFRTAGAEPVVTGDLVVDVDTGVTAVQQANLFASDDLSPASGLTMTVTVPPSHPGTRLRVGAVAVASWSVASITGDTSGLEVLLPADAPDLDRFTVVVTDAQGLTSAPATVFLAKPGTILPLQLSGTVNPLGWSDGHAPAGGGTYSNVPARVLENVSASDPEGWGGGIVRVTEADADGSSLLSIASGSGISAGNQSIDIVPGSATVSGGGALLASWSGGTGGNALIIDLTSAASDAVVSTLLGRLEWDNSSPERLLDGSRSFTITIANGGEQADLTLDAFPISAHDSVPYAIWFPEDLDPRPGETIYRRCAVFDDEMDVQSYRFRVLPPALPGASASFRDEWLLYQAPDGGDADDSLTIQITDSDPAIPWSTVLASGTDHYEEAVPVTIRAANQPSPLIIGEIPLATQAAATFRTDLHLHPGTFDILTSLSWTLEGDVPPELGITADSGDPSRATLIWIPGGGAATSTRIHRFHVRVINVNHSILPGTLVVPGVPGGGG